jgi:YVTN family beta-propeller protein
VLGAICCHGQLVHGRLGRILGAAALGLLSWNAAAAAAHPGALDDYVFVAARGSSAIAIIDATLDEVVASVPLPGPPKHYVVSDEQRMLVASHPQRRALSMLSLDDPRPKVLELDFDPEQIQLDGGGDTLAVSSRQDGVVALVSLKAGRVAHVVQSIARPADLMFDKTGATLLVADATTGMIYAVDVATGNVRRQIDLRNGASQLPGIVELTRTIGGLFGFALHGDGGEMSVIDLRSLEQVSMVKLPGPAREAYPTGANQYVLVPSERDHSVSLISTWTFRESARLAGGAQVSGINVGMLDSVAFVLRPDQDKATVLDLDARREVGEIPLPSHPETGISLDAGRKLYVALSGTDRVAVIDMAQRKLVKMIDGVGDQPWGVSSVSELSYCH